MDYIEVCIAVSYGFGIMALLAASFGTIERKIGNFFHRSVLHGLTFGTGAVMAMNLPAKMGEGIIIDGRATIVGMVAAFGGVPAAIVSAVMVAGYRVHLGGAGVTAGSLGVILAAAMGLVWAHYFKPTNRIATRHLIVLGLLIGMNTLSAVVLPYEVILKLLEAVIPALIAASVIGAVAMGKLIERERGQMRSEAYWKTHAVTDPLTGLPNRRKFYDTYEQMVVRGGEADAALMIIDVDHFKSVNDGYGHAAGDAALVFLAGILRERIRKSDHICRLGGEEFAVLLPDTVPDNARHVAEMLRRGVETAQFVWDGNAVPMTVSIGVAAKTRLDGTMSLDLFDAADASLYEAKEAGRNMVIMTGEKMSGADNAYSGKRQNSHDSTLERETKVRVA